MDPHECSVPLTSAVSYRVEAVDEHQPASLADFLGGGEVGVDVLDVLGRPVRIVGTTRRDGCAIRLDETGGRHARRTWRIDERGSMYTITTRATIR